MSEKSAPAARTRGERTADAIERAAVDLVLEHGYDEVTVAMICDVVGISQRTFFNHYPAKEDALLGRHMPHIDESAVRRFIVGDGPMLLEAMGIVTAPPDVEAVSLDERLQVISSHPTLMTAQMRRILALEADLREIIELRVRHQHPDRGEAEIRDIAVVVTHLMAGMIRVVGTFSHERSAHAAAAEASGACTEAGGACAEAGGAAGYADTLEHARAMLRIVLDDAAR
ncbi:TetR/AcrR family transcriptional regulator [Brachybacterium sp. DNPG3]